MPFQHHPGHNDSAMAQALFGCRSGLVGVFIFSIVMNVLLLTGPFFMLQIYDRVLTSQSVETLLALSILATVLFLFYGVFDWVRMRLLNRISHNFDRDLAETAFRHAATAEPNGRPITSDLKEVQQFIGGPAIASLFDAPWFPVYLLIVYLMHPLLGYLGLAGAVALLSVALLSQILSSRSTGEIAKQRSDEERFLLAGRRQSETLRAMGMSDDTGRLWRDKHDAHLDGTARATDQQAVFTSFSRTTRLLLQSAILGFGAYLVLGNELSAGAMIAASIIFARALAPLDQSIAHWRVIAGARNAYFRLKEALGEPTSLAAPTKIALPKRRLSVHEVFVATPDQSQVLLEGVSFDLRSGDALGIIGPSGGGKTTLLRGILALWPKTRGEVRLDGATLNQWPADRRGDIVGYLSQDIELLPGTIAQNIARFRDGACPDDVTAAAQSARVHDLIVRLPDGYDTVIGIDGHQLSGGERQRIALARAIYRKPFLVVLDEPNSNMDSIGEKALAETVRELRRDGAIVLIVTHRNAILAEVNKLLHVESGSPVVFGQKERVVAHLQKMAEAAIAKGNLRVVD